MASDLLQVEDPAPVVAIAKSTTNEWTDDQCNSPRVQDKEHSSCCNLTWAQSERKRWTEGPSRPSHRCPGGPGNTNARSSAGTHVEMRGGTTAEPASWTGRAMGTHSLIDGLRGSAGSVKAMKRISEPRSRAVLRPTEVSNLGPDDEKPSDSSAFQFP